MKRIKSDKIILSDKIFDGYIYFDWNIDSNDAGSDIYNSSNIYYNVVNHLSHSKTNVVLMHDSNEKVQTVEVLPDIIMQLKNEGYTFKTLDELGVID